MQRSKKTDPFLPVTYYGRQISPEENNFHSYEFETPAVVCPLRKFRIYLLGKRFKIINGSALKGGSTFDKRDLIPRKARWWSLLLEMNCAVKFRAGAKMSHVDALSRNPIVSTEESKMEASVDYGNYSRRLTAYASAWGHRIDMNPQLSEQHF